MFHSCGTLLITKKEESLFYSFCPRCKERIPLANKKHVTNMKENTKTIVLHSSDLEGPSVSFICPNENCESIRAIEMVKPPMFGDEEDLIMYKCVKCGLVTRESTRIS